MVIAANLVVMSSGAGVQAAAMWSPFGAVEAQSKDSPRNSSHPSTPASDARRFSDTRSSTTEASDEETDDTGQHPTG